MGYPTKIATCCYCGSRAALVLGKDRHELSCASCGAPLHDMKRLRQEPASKDKKKTFGHQRPKPKKRPKRDSYCDDRPQRRRHRKKRKGLMHHFLEEAFDAIEDIFD